MQVEVKQRMGNEDVAEVSRLLEDAAAVDGHRPLGEHKWLDLVQGGRRGFLGLVAWQPGHDHPVGYAQLSKGAQSWGVELVVDPHHRDPKGGVGTELLAVALRQVAMAGGGHVHFWVPKPTAAEDAIAANNGLSPGRELRQLVRGLPAEPPRGDLKLRPFVPSKDEEAWLELNNAAFSWHPEQGGWDLATLRQREAEPWFDAEGFLLAEGPHAELIGFCWTKVHLDHDPPLGEIYVVAVDPSWQGKGLGRQLVLAGLDFLARKGLPRAMLYVDAENKPALRLYDALGFSIDHVDRAYVGDVAPAPGTTLEVVQADQASDAEGDSGGDGGHK